jgi:Putative Actinobacterial Holin-X, holin superfamily III
MIDDQPHPPLRELLTGISAGVQRLAAQTLTLARLEVSTAAATLGRSAMGVVAGALAIVAGIAVVVSALVLILIALGLSAWAAATLVGLLLTAGAPSPRAILSAQCVARNLV